MKQIKNYWDSLNERERFILGFGVLFSCLYLVYSLLYAPLAHGVVKKREALIEKRETLAWMKSQSHPSVTPRVISNGQLLTELTEQLKQTQFKQFAYQLQQGSQGEVQLSFDEVPFVPFMNWLYGFMGQVKVTQLNAERIEKPGVVKLSVMMTAESK